jgi:acyl carrier protein
MFVTQGFTQEIVSSRVENIICEQVGSDTSLSSETHLQDDLGMDSLELVELGVTLENEFSVPLPDADVRRCATLNDVIQLVLRAESEEKVRSA